MAGTGGTTTPVAGTGGDSGVVMGSGGQMPLPSGSGGMVSAGTGGAMATPDAGGGSAPAAGGPFQCSEMIGLWVMSQWWGAFEKGVDTAAWQYIFVHHGYLEGWADPANAYWKTAVISPCGQNSATPDRVIFLPFSLTLNTGEAWQTNISKVVDNIKMKFPGVKRIELISTIRNPMNQPCANDKDPNIVVPQYVDDAIKAVADASGGLVTVGPKIEVGACSWWGGGTDLTGAGNTGVGQLYAAYYKDHP
ncbi:MAG TPA: hypothetical protein VMU50_08140 [Polyangia bacterium]|nr:hypothetical protein [Polyangia bacterium]